MTPEHSCGGGPRASLQNMEAKVLAWAWANTLGNLVGNVGGGVKEDGEMALGWDRGTSLSEMSLQMIMLTKTFYLVTWKEHIWVISAEISKLKAWRPECK